MIVYEIDSCNFEFSEAFIMQETARGASSGCGDCSRRRLDAGAGVHHPVDGRAASVTMPNSRNRNDRNENRLIERAAIGRMQYCTETIL